MIGVMEEGGEEGGCKTCKNMQLSVTTLYVFPDWQIAALCFSQATCVIIKSYSLKNKTLCPPRAAILQVLWAAIASPIPPHPNYTPPPVSVYVTAPECSIAMKKICSSKRAELAHAMLVSNANHTEIELPHVDVCISHACCRQSPPAGGPMCFVIKSEQSLCGAGDVFIKTRQ